MQITSITEKMLNKRRRASSVASKDDDVIDDSTPEQSPVLSVGTARKRKRPDPVS